MCFHSSVAASATDLVKSFLRAQNLEQLGRVDEATRLYEDAVSGGFDSIGPYDRLIEIYSSQALHAEVVRIAETALRQVHTYEEKRVWYRSMRDAAEAAAKNVPKAAQKSPHSR